jgi:hypothetical protein
VRRPSDATLLVHRVVILGSAEVAAPPPFSFSFSFSFSCLQVGKTSLVNHLPSAPSSHVYAGLPRPEGVRLTSHRSKNN